MALVQARAQLLVSVLDFWFYIFFLGGHSKEKQSRKSCVRSSGRGRAIGCEIQLKYDFE